MLDPATSTPSTHTVEAFGDQKQILTPEELAKKMNEVAKRQSDDPQ